MTPNETKPTWPVCEVDGLDCAFGGNMRDLLPPMADIADDFKNFNRQNKWTKFQADWFYHGLVTCDVKPNPGIDVDKALAHLEAIQRSWEPQHEHKVAGVAYLASLWFEDVTYTKGTP